MILSLSSFRQSVFLVRNFFITAACAMLIAIKYYETEIMFTWLFQFLSLYGQISFSLVTLLYTLFAL